MRRIRLEDGETLEVTFAGHTCRLTVEHQYPEPEDGVWCFVWREGEDEPEGIEIKQGVDE